MVHRSPLHPPQSGHHGPHKQLILSVAELLSDNSKWLHQNNYDDGKDYHNDEKIIVG